MSELIEMADISEECSQEERPPHNLKEMIKTIIKYPEF
jgi:hypothetical protein